MKTYIIPVLMALSLLACSKKEEEKTNHVKKGFELSNTMLNSVSLAKVEKKEYRR